jgi:hypothetical protein
MTEKTQKSRSWICTLNFKGKKEEQCTPEAAQLYLERWFARGDVRFLRGQIEKGSEGTLHIQYAVNFKEPTRMSALKKHCAHSHFTKVGRDNGIFQYVAKVETHVAGPWEYGEFPFQQNSKLDIKAKNARIIEIGAKAAVDEGLVRIEQIQKIQTSLTVYRNLNQSLEPLPVLQNEWHWGPTGTGKSMTCRTKYPDAYIKGANIWWCNYAGQDDVLLEEMEPQKIGGGHMKRWADHYCFSVEVKGSQITIRPKRIIVTSNYSIRECYPLEQDYLPLERRFTVHHYSASPFSKGAATD